VATPEELSATELHPGRSLLLPPPLKATVPVGVPDAEDTVAVNVSVWPGDVGLGDTFSDVDVAACADVISRVTVPVL
jgi:hypothetical protein